MCYTLDVECEKFAPKKWRDKMHRINQAKPKLDRFYILHLIKLYNQVKRETKLGLSNPEYIVKKALIMDYNLSNL
jgi:hypothetical protein